jgi:hypothetical protein
MHREALFFAALLTYMATTEQLIERKALTRVDVPLYGGERPWRSFLALERLIHWMTDALPSLEGNWGDLNPIQQLDAVLADFVSGAPLEFRRHVRVIRPHHDAVWELRTTDLRVFGWFAARNVFIGSSAGLKHQIERYGLYPEHRDLAIKDRVALDLDPPKCVYGVKYDNILSDAD